MKTIACIAAGCALTAATGLLAACSSVAPANIALPPESATLKPSQLAGYATAAQKCGICHSADYVEYQPPAMTRAQWTAEMTKMQRLYGAPISDEEVKLLGIYLAVAYGDATTVSASDLELQR